MQRIAPLDDAQVVSWEERLEAQMVTSLQAVMDQIAARIAKIQVASAWLDAARIEVDIPLRALIAAVTTGPDGDDLPPPMTGELAIPDPPILPEVLPDTPALPPGQPYISPDDLASIAPLWQQQVAEQILPLVAQVFIDSAGNIRSQLLESVAPNVTVAMPRLGSIAAEQYLATARKSFDEIGEHLWATARAQMSQGFDAGESIPQIADRLRQSAGLTARQGVLVARTSVIEASNSGSLQMAQVSGLQMQKEWISTLGDGRTRPSHLAADGKRVGLNEPFVLITGNSGMFPADPSFPPADRYRCRCTIGYILPDRPKEIEPPLGPRLDQLPGTSRPAIEGLPKLEPGEEGPLTALFPKESGPGFDLPARGEGVPPSYVRPSLRAAKTPRELRRVWQDEVQAITGFPFVVDAMPRGISLVTAREYAEGTLQMFAQFPGARLDRVHWFDDAASSSYAQVRRGGHAIEFNMRYASETGRPKFLAARRKDAAGWDTSTTSWGVRNDVSGQGVVYHEFTHILDIENTREAIHGGIVPLLIQHAQREGITDIDDLIKRQISSYATKNYQEMIAEAGADVMVNGAAASQLSKDIFGLLRAEYRRRGFEIRTGPALPEDFGEAFPKAAAPRALSSQTVAQLRALAKERGITVPAGTRKADLVKMLEEAPTAPAVVPAAIVEVPPLSRAPLAYQARQAELREAAARPVLEGKSRRMSGESAYTTKVEHQGGPPTVTKDYTRQNETLAQGRRSADAEELGALVDDAVGLRAPTVIRTGPRSIEESFLEGQSGEEILPWPHTVTDELIGSDDGRLIGLSDILVGESDRNAGNFIRLADGRLASIDRGGAFQTPKLAGAQSPFAQIFAPEGRWAKTIDIAPQDLAVIRARLEALRPEFERLGRATWHKQVMARLAEVEKRATGTTIRLPEARADLSAITSPAGRAAQRAEVRARAAAVAAQRGNAALLARVDELIQAKASKAVIRQEFDPALREAEQLYAGADEGLANALRDALDSGEPAKIRAALTRQSKLSQITPIGKAGAKAKFDPDTMEGVGGTAIPDGADVIVVRRGAKLAGIETPEKAVVRLAAPSVTEESAATARVLARLDELRAHGGATRKEFFDVINTIGEDASVDALLVPADIMSSLRLAVGLEPEKMAVRLRELTTKAKIKSIGRAGAKTKFDPDTMEMADGAAVPAGTRVEIVRRGSTVPGAAKPIIEKAQVRLPDTGPSVKDLAERARPSGPLTRETFGPAVRQAKSGREALEAAPVDLRDASAVERFSPRVRGAVEHYRGEGYRDINDYLRGRNPGTGVEQDFVDQIDTLFDQSPLASDIELWRAPGTGRSIFGDLQTWGSDLTGFTWADAAYSSGTAVERIADRFAVSSGVRLHMFVPRGTPALKLSNWSMGGGEEAEILLARGAQFRVVRDRGWTTIKHPTSHQEIRIRDLDVEVTVPDVAPPLPRETK